MGSEPSRAARIAVDLAAAKAEFETAQKILTGAFQRYHAARNREVERAAFYEIILRGGVDGYPNTDSRWRIWVARKLRGLAAWVDKF